MSHGDAGLTILKAWLQVFSWKIIAGGGPRVSSGGGGAMLTLRISKGPTKDKKGPIPTH